MHTITSNATGTRTMQISDDHLATIEKYSLFRNLVDSNGIVDDSVLEKLRLNTRALIESTNAQDRSLLDFCFEVLYHPNMKPTALHNLLVLYIEVSGERYAPTTDNHTQKSSASDSILSPLTSYLSPLTSKK